MPLMENAVPTSRSRSDTTLEPGRPVSPRSQFDSASRRTRDAASSAIDCCVPSPSGAPAMLRPASVASTPGRRAAPRRPSTASITWSATVRPKRPSHACGIWSELVMVPVASALVDGDRLRCVIAQPRVADLDLHGLAAVAYRVVDDRHEGGCLRGPGPDPIIDLRALAVVRPFRSRAGREGLEVETDILRISRARG